MLSLFIKRIIFSHIFFPNFSKCIAISKIKYNDTIIFLFSARSEAIEAFIVRVGAENETIPYTKSIRGNDAAAA